jgi:hypothetical protein
MERKEKIKVLEAIKAGLPASKAMKSEKYKVLFPHQDHYTTSIDGLGERVSKAEAELLQKYFPESIYISNISGISYDPE